MRYIRKEEITKIELNRIDIGNASHTQDYINVIIYFPSDKHLYNVQWCSVLERFNGNVLFSLR